MAYAYHTRTECVPYAYRMSTECVPYAYRVRTVCVPYAYRVRTVYVPYADRMSTMRTTRTVIADKHVVRTWYASGSHLILHLGTLTLEISEIGQDMSG